jgi:hypothetical protein
VDIYIFSSVDLLGLHFLGTISLGTQYARGTVAKPIPIMIWAPITRKIVVEPGAIAAPIKEIIEGPTRRAFRAWKVSEAEEIRGETTA